MNSQLPTSPDEKFDRRHRQQLSALMDGELAADEARFLLRRLEHDQELSACQERWQLLGDAMRGQAYAPAPLDFAARVQAAVRADGRLSPPAARPVKWTRWGGAAALAASVAAVAMFVSREQVVAPAAQQVIASQAQLPSLEVAKATLPVAAPSAAVAQTTRQARSQPVERAVAVTAPPVRSRPVASSARQAPPATAVAAVALVDPFTTPEQVLKARPWPRSTPVENALPQRVFNANAPGGGSFYPFEPRMQDDTALRLRH